MVLGQVLLSSGHGWNKHVAGCLVAEELEGSGPRCMENCCQDKLFKAICLQITSHASSSVVGIMLPLVGNS